MIRETPVLEKISQQAPGELPERDLVIAIISNAINEAKLRSYKKEYSRKNKSVNVREEARNWINPTNRGFRGIMNLLGIDEHWAAELIWSDLREFDNKKKG